MTTELKFTPVFTDGDLRAEIVARIDGQPIARQKVNLSSDISRRRFRKAVVDADSSIPGDEIDRELLRIADEVQAEHARRKQAPADEDSSEPIGDSVAPLTLTAAKAVFAKWIRLDDWTILDVVLGTVMVHRIEGDPLWLFIVGPPGAIKTEILRTVSPHQAIYPLSTLSPNAMISGYVTDGPDPSLLPRLDGKVLIVKDFTTILQMHREGSELTGSTKK